MISKMGKGIPESTLKDALALAFAIIPRFFRVVNPSQTDEKLINRIIKIMSEGHLAREITMWYTFP